MRFLKSLLFLSLCFVAIQAFAQNAGTSEKDSVPVFQADKISGGLVWQQRLIPDTALQHLRSDEAFWYANADLKKKLESPDSQLSFLQGLFRQRWFHQLLWTIIICAFATVVVLFLWKSDVRLFHKKPTRLAPVNETGDEENIFTIVYDVALQKARAQHDFRMAIRLHYLEVLTLLSQKNTIRYKEEYTNSDYLLQLRHSRHYGPFKKLTHHFGYAWYGNFPVTDAAFEIIESDFSTFKSTIDI